MPGGIGSVRLLPMAMMLMLSSGTLNTLLMKFMTMQQVPLSPGGVSRGFEHPFFQTLLMMVGEIFCLAAYYATSRKEDRAKEASDVPNRIFMVACSLDWAATTLVNMAYVLIAASVVQMTRGAIVIFTCLFSVLFLGRRQHAYHIAGVVLVFVGITLVSLSAFVNPADTAQHQAVRHSVSKSLAGVSLCICAQVFQATMLVYEESIMSQYALPPLRVVGMEGAFGLLLGVALLGALNAFEVESTPQAIYQMQHSTPLLVASIASICSIAVFNYSGVTVTQQASAVARSTIDVSRTVLIWAVELALGWNSFNSLQLLGFVVLAVGTMIYNRLLVLPMLEPALETSAIMAQAYKLPQKAPAHDKPDAATV